jgi:glycine/sarcosine N-methyltransferase
MNTPQNDFYSSISKYYHEIFPYNPVQLKFTSKYAEGLEGKRILDIGCATGELAYQLAKAGAVVTGIDLNEDLLFQAKTKKVAPNLIFQKGDMMELETDFRPHQFDTILCFGNTLVHLSSDQQVYNMISGVHKVLKPKGVFMLQILNYDYILSEKVTQLPVIETPAIKFVRNYVLENNNPVIRFKTELHIKNETRVVYNETPLLALQSRQVKDLLTEAGFTDISLFASFKEESFGGNHLPLVVKASTE